MWYYASGVLRVRRNKQEPQRIGREALRDPGPAPGSGLPVGSVHGHTRRSHTLWVGSGAGTRHAHSNVSERVRADQDHQRAARSNDQTKHQHRAAAQSWFKNPEERECGPRCQVPAHHEAQSLR